jgi:hypothetical protein
MEKSGLLDPIIHEAIDPSSKPARSRFSSTEPERVLIGLEGRGSSRSKQHPGIESGYAFKVLSVDSTKNK